jgi:hydroxyacylglutathione hydrolase
VEGKSQEEVEMKIGKNIHFLCGTYGSNIGIIKGDSEIAIVEGGWTAETAGLALEYMNEIKEKASLKYLFMTHADRDHVGGCKTFKEAGAKIVIHEAEAKILDSPPPPAEAAPADIILKEDTKMKVGNLEVQFIYTPGHTPGSMCVYYEKEGILFPGDTVLPDFAHPVMGRILHPPFIRQGIEIYVASLKKLLALDTQWILPGHGKAIRNTKEWIKELIQRSETFPERAYKLLEGEMTPTELAVKLQAFPPTAQFLVDLLKKQGRITEVGEKVVQKEPLYKRK